MKWSSRLWKEVQRGREVLEKRVVSGRKLYINLLAEHLIHNYIVFREKHSHHL